jgi:LysR family cyn operon transcriptional activator
MELRHLRYFEALAQCLHFTRAAERVHVTQSTLSHQIKQLEEEVGQRLFDRIGKRVVITEAGEIFLSSASKALKEIDQGLGRLKEASTDLTGEIRIGATHTFNIGFIPSCVANFLSKYPTVKITVEELAADLIARRLAEGALDIGIAYRPSDSNDLLFEPLYNEEMVLVVSSEHAFASRKRIRMVELHRQKLVLLPETFSTRIMLNECFRNCGAEPSVIVEMNTIAPMLGLASRTLIGTIVSRNAVPALPGLHVVLLESPTPVRTPGILWRREQ